MRKSPQQRPNPQNDAETLKNTGLSLWQSCSFFWGMSFVRLHLFAAVVPYGFPCKGLLLFLAAFVYGLLGRLRLLAFLDAPSVLFVEPFHVKRVRRPVKPCILRKQVTVFANRLGDGDGFIATKWDQTPELLDEIGNNAESVYETVVFSASRNEFSLPGNL